MDERTDEVSFISHIQQSNQAMSHDNNKSIFLTDRDNLLGKYLIILDIGLHITVIVIYT